MTLRRGFSAALLTLFMLRAIIPSGMMINPAWLSSNQAFMIICHSGGLEHLLPEQDHQLHHAPNGMEHTNLPDTCPYGDIDVAALTVFGDVPAAPLFAGIAPNRLFGTLVPSQIQTPHSRAPPKDLKFTS